MFDLNDRTVLITGSTRGLGFVLAKGFAKAGAHVVLNGTSEKTLKKAQDELSGISDRISGYAFDVTDYKKVEQIIPIIEKESGPIDVLINNAGIHRRAPLSEMNMADWSRVIEVNLNAVFFLSQQVVRRMTQRGGGTIINISSLNAEGARPTIANYCSAKGGIKMLTRSMATEWGPLNIRTNAIGPGYFKTELTQGLSENPDFDAWVKQEVPLARWGDPEELVGTAIYLASPASSYVNGISLYVDGGWQASL